MFTQILNLNFLFFTIFDRSGYSDFIVSKDFDTMFIFLFTIF